MKLLLINLITTDNIMKQQKFSLIEIAISLAVAFLAITVLIAFFPTSFKRIKNAQSRAYATNSAQQFSVYLKNTLTTYPIPDRYKTSGGSWNSEYQTYLTKWQTQVTTTKDSDPTNSLPIAAYQADDVSYSETDYPIPSGFDGTLVQRHKTIPSVYLVRNITLLNGNSHVDNIIEVRVWKSPYVFGLTLFPGNPGTGSAGDPHNYENDYSKAARINMEFSWPVTIAYSQRKSKTYKFLDLAK